MSSESHSLSVQTAKSALKRLDKWQLSLEAFESAYGQDRVVTFVRFNPKNIKFKKKKQCLKIHATSA